MKIIRNILVGIFSVVALVFGLIFYSSSRTIPLKDRQQLSGGAVQVKDGMVSVGLIPSGDGQVMLVDCGNLGDSADSGKDGRLLPAKRFVSNDMGQNHASLKKLAKKLKPQTPEIQFMEFAHSGPLPGIVPLLNFAKNTPTKPPAQ